MTRINQYELAFRMQMAVPDVMDIRQEPDNVRTLYGAEPGKLFYTHISDQYAPFSTRAPMPIRQASSIRAREPRGTSWKPVWDMLRPSNRK